MKTPERSAIDRATNAIEMLRALYIHNSSGGNLHVCVDDGNMEDGNVWWCLQEAAKEKDLEGVQIAVYLLTMSVDERFDLYDRYDEYAR